MSGLHHANPVKMSVPFLDLTALHREIEGEIDEAIHRVIHRGSYILGREVEAFEEAFATYVKARYCVGVANGTEALALALAAVGVRPGDEVIVPNNTCSPTWLAVLQIGAVPIGVEPDPATMTMDVSAIAEMFSKRTRAVVPVHLYGLPADLLAISEVCGRHNVPVVEDAAQAHGARIGNTPIGALSEATAWSYYPTKNLGALGDGGAVTTNNETVNRSVRSLRNYGWHDAERYVSHEAGLNSRLDELQAAVLRVKLLHLDDWNARRRAIAQRYTSAIRGSNIAIPDVPSWADPAWHCYVVRSPQRDRLREYLGQHGTATLIHYPSSPADQPFARVLPSARSSHPITSTLCQQVLSLPIDPCLSDEQVDHVIGTVNSFGRANDQ
ncbi:MAG: DegT/DnrJ/EryC1/StrS family aminotransferase [Acidimicrobiales bacterium]